MCVCIYILFVNGLFCSLKLWYCRDGLHFNLLEIQTLLEDFFLQDLSLGFFLMFILQLLMKLEKYI